MVTKETLKVLEQTLTAADSTVVRSAAANDDSVIIAPPNKKLQMLAATEPSEPVSTSTDDYAYVISHEVTAYLSSLRLADKEKLSLLIFWKNYADIYPNMAMLTLGLPSFFVTLATKGCVVTTHP